MAPARDEHLLVPPVLLALTWVEGFVLLGTGAGLFFAPAAIDDIWPWELTPFNTRFLGAIYLSSLAAVGITLWRRRWSPARLLAPMILTFTAAVLVVSVLTTGPFRGGEAAWMTAAWFVLYLILPINAAWHLWRYRERQWWGGPALPPAWRAYLRAEAAVVGAYGLAMLMAGDAVTGFWPWPIDDFHARIYSAVFLTGGVGPWLLARGGFPVEAAMVGLVQVVLGSLAVVGLVVVDRSTHRVDWGAGGTWLWVGWFTAGAAGGLLLARHGLRDGGGVAPAAPEHPHPV